MPSLCSVAAYISMFSANGIGCSLSQNFRLLAGHGQRLRAGVGDGKILPTAPTPNTVKTVDTDRLPLRFRFQLRSPINLHSSITISTYITHFICRDTCLQLLARTHSSSPGPSNAFLPPSHPSSLGHPALGCQILPAPSTLLSPELHSINFPTNFYFPLESRRSLMSSDDLHRKSSLTIPAYATSRSYCFFRAAELMLREMCVPAAHALGRRFRTARRREGT